MVFKLSLKEGLQGNALLLHGATGILRDSRKEETQLGWRLSGHSERQHSEVGEQLLPSDSDHRLVRGGGGVSARESGAVAAVGSADTGCFSGNPERSQLKQVDDLNPLVLSTALFLPSFPFFFPSLPPLPQLPFSLNSICVTSGPSSSDTQSNHRTCTLQTMILL